MSWLKVRLTRGACKSFVELIMHLQDRGFRNVMCKNAGLLLLLCLLLLTGCRRQVHVVNRGPAVPPHPDIRPLPANAPPQLTQMLDGAIAQAGDDQLRSI